MLEQRFVESDLATGETCRPVAGAAWGTLGVPTRRSTLPHRLGSSRPEEGQPTMGNPGARLSAYTDMRSQHRLGRDKFALLALTMEVRRAGDAL